MFAALCSIVARRRHEPVFRAHAPVHFPANVSSGVKFLVRCDPGEVLAEDERMDVVRSLVRLH